MRRRELEQAFARADAYADERHPNGGPLHGSTAYAFLKGYLGIGIAEAKSGARR